MRGKRAPALAPRIPAGACPAYSPQPARTRAPVGVDQILVGRAKGVANAGIGLPEVLASDSADLPFRITPARRSPRGGGVGPLQPVALVSRA